MDCSLFTLNIRLKMTKRKLLKFIILKMRHNCKTYVHKDKLFSN